MHIPCHQVLETPRQWRGTGQRRGKSGVAAEELRLQQMQQQAAKKALERKEKMKVLFKFVLLAYSVRLAP